MIYSYTTQTYLLPAAAGGIILEFRQIWCQKLYILQKMFSLKS